jgi:hypothetical protein
VHKRVLRYAVLKAGQISDYVLPGDAEEWLLSL